MIIPAYKPHYIKNHRRGFTLLLMVVLLAVFLSIGMGITNILLGQVVIIGQAQESFRALYAADIAMERTLYRDRSQDVCGTPSNCTTGVTPVPLPNGACYAVGVQVGPSAGCPGPSTRCVDVVGQDVCDGGLRFVRRSFNVKY